MSVRVVRYENWEWKLEDEWKERRTHITSSFGSMSLLSRMAFSTAPPSLPVALVRASILIVGYVWFLSDF